MSTPTTATATLPPHYRHHHHPGPHYPPYSANSSSYRSVAGVSANPILPTTTASTATGSNRHHTASSSSYTHNPTYVSTQPLQQSTNGVAASVANARQPRDSSTTNSTPRLDSNQVKMPPTATATQTQTKTDSLPRKRRRSKEPDWGTFYKNGLPKEVIVIHDTPDPEPDQPSYSVATSTRPYANGTKNSTTRHPAKRRRKEEGSYAGSVNGSYQQTSNSGSISTDRTTSAHNTTAATSLGSLSSNGHYEYEAAQHAGQKRKRTRHQVAQEAKRREVEVLSDALASYQPPQKPVKKAGDVTVRVVSDVSDPNSCGESVINNHFAALPPKRRACGRR